LAIERKKQKYHADLGRAAESLFKIRMAIALAIDLFRTDQKAATSGDQPRNADGASTDGRRPRLKRMMA